MKSFAFAVDTNHGFNTFIRPAPDYIESVVLGAGVAQTISIPSPARGGVVLFSANKDFFALMNSAAAIPSGTTTDGTGSELNPVAWRLNGVNSISLIAAATTTLSLAFYRK